jgi:hypothetical protein
MENTITFGEVLDAAEKLSLDEQETLIEILRRRAIERRRDRLAKDIKEAEKEFREGKCKPASVDEIMKEILF